ncbi:MAG: DUF6655 family protein [Pirellulaceae bacterium]
MSKTEFLLPIVSLVVCLSGFSGCGTTRLTDTARSASEEMLLSHSIDASVGQLDLEVLAGHAVYLDTTNLGNVSFSEYLTGALRQHLLASGARLANDLEEAQLVLEARAGSVATTQHESMLGIPRTTVPAIVFGTAATLPEIAIIKETIHIGVTKVGVFAYRTDNGAGVWQSGMAENQSVSQTNWYLGVGPFHTGDVILDGGRNRRVPGSFSRQFPRRRSPLEFESWVGEMPPAEPWLPPQIPFPESNGEERPNGPPEEIDPGAPEQTPVPDDSWQLISPVVVSPQGR